MKAIIPVLFLFTAAFLGFSTVHLASADNGTSINGISSANPGNFCSTGVMNAQGLCSQPALDSQGAINSQPGILVQAMPSAQASNPNTYWCKPGTSDSNLCGMTAGTLNPPSGNPQTVTSQAGILSQGINTTASANTNQNTAINQGVNSAFYGTMISPNSLGFFTNPNAVCATGTTIESQGLCVNSQGLQGYYSSANCNFGVDPATNQCMRTSPIQTAFPQAGVLAQGNSVSPGTVTLTNPELDAGASMASQGLNSQTLPYP